MENTTKVILESLKKDFSLYSKNPFKSTNEAIKVALESKSYPITYAEPISREEALRVAQVEIK